MSDRRTPWFAPIQPGLEPVLARELAARGIDGTVEPGGVAFSASLRRGAELVRRLRSPSRLRCEICRGRATSLQALASLVRRASWRDVLQPELERRISVSSRNSRLSRRQAIARKVDHSIADALRRGRRRRPIRGATAPQQVHVRLEADEATVSIDAGGELLHRRGWRTEGGRAPLRENLAAALLWLAGYDGEEPFLDPMCGAGTLPIEAALMSAGRSPFVGRSFACDDWPALSGATPASPPRRPPGEVHGSDSHPEALARARRNARRAGVQPYLQELELAQRRPPAPRGLIVTNPPYGRRLGRSVEGVYRSLGEQLRAHFRGWRVLYLAPHVQLARQVDDRAERLTSFRNGGSSVGAWALRL